VIKPVAAPSLPSLSAPNSVNHTVPSPATATSFGVATEVGTGYSVNAPLATSYRQMLFVLNAAK